MSKPQTVRQSMQMAIKGFHHLLRVMSHTVLLIQAVIICPEAIFYAEVKYIDYGTLSKPQTASLMQP